MDNLYLELNPKQIIHQESPYFLPWMHDFNNSDLLKKSISQKGVVSPLILIIPIPPSPGAVAIAAIVSSINIFSPLILDVYII